MRLFEFVKHVINPTIGAEEMATYISKQINLLTLTNLTCA